MNLSNHLRSNNFAILIAILSVIVQSFHSYSVFYRLSSLNGTAWGIAQAVLFSVIIDLAILFYTVRKNVKVTWMAGFIMVLINLFYYYTHLGLGLELIMGGLLSLVIPVSVYYYSEEINDDSMPESVKAATDVVIEALKTVQVIQNKPPFEFGGPIRENPILTADKITEVEFEDRPNDKSLAGIKMPHTDRPTR